MKKHKYLKLLHLSRVIIGFALGIALGLYTRTALAGEGLRAVAEANQRTYYEVKALGPNATPAKVDEIGKRNFGPAYAILQKERNEQFRSGAKHATDKSKVVKKSVDPKSAQQVPLANAYIKDTADEKSAKKSRSISGAKSSTPNFQFEGTGHAKSVDFGIAPKK